MIDGLHFCHLQIEIVKYNNRLARDELNATFADIPAPQLEWEEMPSAPVPRLDGAAIQIKNLLYVFAGYGSIDHVRTFHLLQIVFVSHK